MQLCSSLSILWHCLSKGLEWKLTFSSPVVMAEFPNLLAYWVQHFNRRTFVGKVTSLLFNMLSRLVIAFLPRSKHLLISWLQSPSAGIFGTQENKVCHCLHCLPIYLPWSNGAVKVLHSICQQIWKTQQWPQGLVKVSFHSNPKERQCQRMLKLPHNCTHLTC